MEHDFDDLAGRIDGVARFAMYVATKLHRDGLADVTDLIAITRQSATTRDTGNPVATASSRATLAELADELENALRSTGHLP